MLCIWRIITIVLQVIEKYLIYFTVSLIQYGCSCFVCRLFFFAEFRWTVISDLWNPNRFIILLKHINNPFKLSVSFTYRICSEARIQVYAYCIHVVICSYAIQTLIIFVNIIGSSTYSAYDNGIRIDRFYSFISSF